MQFMFANATLSTSNYDALLIGWNNLGIVQSRVKFDAGNSTYSVNAVAARDFLRIVPS